LNYSLEYNSTKVYVSFMTTITTYIRLNIVLDFFANRALVV